MSAFDRLHPALQHHIVNSLGWNTLRPLQEQAIDPILAGEDALLIAPTASGKTEAAVFPVLSRMLAERWAGLSVLYVCPLKALLNSLEHRLQSYAGSSDDVSRSGMAMSWAASGPGSVVSRRTSCSRLLSPSR